MGGCCAKCSELRKAQPGPGGIRPEDLEDEVECKSEDSKEIALESEVEETEEELRQQIQEVLAETGRSLRRGRTLAMREAINAAKKRQVPKGVIQEAEKLLEDHVLRHRRAELEAKAAKYLAQSQDLEECSELLEEAEKCKCPELQRRLKHRLEELQITRPLTPEEVTRAETCVRQSCLRFLELAAADAGREVLVLNLDAGDKSSGSLHLDAPLQNLTLKQTLDEGVRTQGCRLATLSASLAQDDRQVREQRGFLELEHGERHHCVAVHCEVNGKRRIWCFVEPSTSARDHLLEALRVLSYKDEAEEVEDD
ncbi:unnamed protein product [Effrenium voratum]|nr:unnamed protein product [Effrenium voratum]